MVRSPMSVLLKSLTLAVQPVSLVERERIECRERRGSAIFRVVLVFGRYVNFSKLKLQSRVIQMLLCPPKSSEYRARISLHVLLVACAWSDFALELRSAICAVPLGRQAVHEGRSATSRPPSDESPHPSKGKHHLDHDPSYDKKGFSRLFSSPGRHREGEVRERCHTAREVRTRMSAMVHRRYLYMGRGIREPAPRPWSFTAS